MKSATQPASVVSINHEETATPASEFLQTPQETKENHKNQKNHMIFPYDFFCDFSTIFPSYDISEIFYDFYRIK